MEIPYNTISPDAALGILTAASLALAPAFAAAGSTDTTENKRREAGPVTSASHQIGHELTPDVLIVTGLGFTGLIFCVLVSGGGGDGSTTTTASATTTQ